MKCESGDSIATKRQYGTLVPHEGIHGSRCGNGVTKCEVRNNSGYYNMLPEFLKNICPRAEMRKYGE
jgi:hypothetical protein